MGGWFTFFGCLLTILFIYLDCHRINNYFINYGAFEDCANAPLHISYFIHHFNLDSARIYNFRAQLDGAFIKFIKTFPRIVFFTLFP